MNTIQFDQETANKLTEREKQVAKAASNDMDCQCTADHLGISIKTVQVHRHRLIQKLDAITMAGVVAKLIRGGII